MTAVAAPQQQLPRASRVAWIGVTLGVAVFAFLASPQGPLGTFWRPSPDLPSPSVGLVPFLILLKVWETVTFGLGVAFLLFGYPLVRRSRGRAHGFTVAAYLAVGWSLLNWWPHGSLHVANGMYLPGLLQIEYGFHVTSMIAAAVLARFFWAVVTAGGRRQE